MAPETSQSKLKLALIFGYRLMLLCGVGMLLLAYSDVVERERDLALKISRLQQGNLHHERQRRDIGINLDSIFDRFQKRLASLERRSVLFQSEKPRQKILPSLQQMLFQIASALTG